MKIGVVGDVHWSQYSSIIRSRGNHFSKRLENLIDSIAWTEEFFSNKGCDKVIYLGDFFDRADLNSEEITALTQTVWGNMEHIFLVGNHEMGTSDLRYNSANALASNSLVISNITKQDYGDFEIVYLPYRLSSTEESLKDLIGTSTKKRIIFSHNDLKGIQMGAFKSESGYDIEDIESNCDLFVNGHLHNGSWVTPKIINLGNLTGQNFGEDSFKYEHNVAILDTDDLSLNLYENPMAFNFYKIDYTKAFDFKTLKDNAIITIKCKVEDSNFIRILLENDKRVIEHRVLIDMSNNNIVEHNNETEIDLSINHLESFKDYILSTLGGNDIVKAELMEVVK